MQDWWLCKNDISVVSEAEIIFQWIKLALNDSKDNSGKFGYETPQYLLSIYTGSVSCSSQEQPPFSTEQHAAKPWLEPGSSSDPDSNQEPDLQNPCVHGLLLALFVYDWLRVCIHMKKGARTNQKRALKPSDRDKKNLLSLGRFKEKLLYCLSPLSLCPLEQKQRNWKGTDKI